jgi:UDP-N-acetylmuramate dehydrogenase
MIPSDIRSVAERGAYGFATFNRPLSELSKWRIGGPCALVVEPSETSQVLSFIEDLACAEIPFVVIGAGSNLLFDDTGFDGVCLRVAGRFSGVQIKDRDVIVKAGTWVPYVARATAKKSLTGFEHTIGIPGSMGGLITMNGGSQRCNISEFLTGVTSIDRAGAMVVRNRDECQFSYRNSVFRSINEIVLSAQFRLCLGDKASIRSLMLKTLRERRKKFPLKEPNCGSVFVSDPAMYADLGPPGYVIEKLGLKGFTIGGAKVSERHANFFVNTGTATARDMLSLIRYVQDMVKQETGYQLRTEVLFVDQKGKIAPADAVSGI